MKLLQSIQQWFIKKPTESLPDNNAQFIIDDKQDAHIKIIITDTSQEAAEQFANMLFGIVNGDYTENILQILIDIGSQDKSSNSFVTHLFAHWARLEKLEEDKLLFEPEVKPTSFFKGSKHEQ